MAGKLAILGYVNRLDKHQKEKLNIIIDNLIFIEKEVKAERRVDDLCDKCLWDFTDFIDFYRK